MNERQITLSLIFMIWIGLVLIAVALTIPGLTILSIAISLVGGMLIGTGLRNLYLDWRLRQKWNKRLFRK